jgi:hypothetical protein
MMTGQLDWRNELARKGHRMVLSGRPVTMHCHHYNINLQKTLEDILGEEGVQLVYSSVENAVYDSFKPILNHYSQIKTLKSKLEMASVLYQNSGLGIVHFQGIGPAGGKIVSNGSHHVTGWLAKHGRRETPGCHFTRGWIAGVMEALFENPIGYYQVEEVQCKMVQHGDCIFNATVNLS